MKPILEQIPIERARLCHAAEFLIQRKSDGQHRTVDGAKCGVSGVMLNAELMRDGTHRINDVSILGLTTRERMAELQAIARHLPPGFEIEKSDVELDAEIAAGGEGIVLKPWHLDFGQGWLKAKRSENFLVRVTEGPGAVQSVTIADATTGEPRGKLPLRAGKCDQVRRGSLLKVTGYGLTTRGLIREARPDTDTPTSWLVQY